MMPTLNISRAPFGYRRDFMSSAQKTTTPCWPLPAYKLIAMHFITLLGFAAGTLTTLSFVPQVHKAWRTRRCDDLSLTMLLAFGAGVVLWLIYGLLLHASPIIAANAVTLALIGWLLHLKFRYRQVSVSSNFVASGKE